MYVRWNIGIVAVLFASAVGARAAEIGKAATENLPPALVALGLGESDVISLDVARRIRAAGSTTPRRDDAGATDRPATYFTAADAPGTAKSEAPKSTAQNPPAAKPAAAKSSCGSTTTKKCGCFLGCR